MERFVAWIDDVHLLTIHNAEQLLPLVEKDPSPFVVSEDRKIHYKIKGIEIESTNGVKMTFDEELPLGENLHLCWAGKNIPVYAGKIVRTDWFDERYTAFDTEFGAKCGDTETVFQLWAPTATSVKVIIQQFTFPLEQKPRGVWSLRLEGDWHGSTYEYEVTVNGNVHRVIDPYTKGLLANSEKGVLINFSKTKKVADHRPSIDHLQDAIIYELHVRDATVHPNSGVVHKGKFLGLTEKNTKTKNGFSTGLTYLKELGITHVELLPINDFSRVDEWNPEKDYNWGYDPLFFQVPEGSYSVSPNDPVSRINECKAMIQAFHDEGILVIIDVVFNHLFIQKELSETTFEKIVPGYYFRFWEDGTPSNGTGVGNDLATERLMVRKLILDTIDFWLREYKVDGFRFDLMGVIDTETMRQIVKRVKQEPFPILLLGEGWDLPTNLPSNRKATRWNADQLPDIRYFNDEFRDSLKGSTFNTSEVGYVNGKGKYFERLPFLVSGSCIEEFSQPFVEEPTQVINYVESHDNHTLWDRLSISNEDDSVEIRKKMHQLATGLTLLSQGVPFLHAGQEWFRTKKGDENSYLSGDDINQLDWDRRESEWEQIEFIQSLIAIRKAYSVFRMRSKWEIRKRMYILKTPFPVFGFTLFGDGETFAIFTNPSKNLFPVQLPSSGRWEVLATNSDRKKTMQTKIIGEYTTIEPFELIVLKKQFIH
ncbi:type I pullulanase [Fervidibacillus albus]|uniref:Type I pullulanase n=1 Tax=Fervidibacillus albus TaxID=2980026 RepID=A0A9E8LS88_9BACI|nr:type I pullulanase [Fervidibacillus albus]WAA08542.1 type I pullulanase [Fervidibacillus albus]